MNTTIETAAPTITAAHLPFVQGRNYWSVTPSGDYADDCATGRAYARDALLWMVCGDFGAMLGYIVQAMPRGTNMGGIEIGFLQGIADAAMG